ncbi:uncharacterized protein LOC111133914 isoform X2 [Crassostrea virginica]|uniref:Uncharacterized protein LOC111133914 n=1 Tax=Crassostrea virginica TaxID=6565 RepID=A0A8B8EFA0_CRAVI|nr:uncharacterized protein LOC111133914 [Crassostrea virginica]
MLALLNFCLSHRILTRSSIDENTMRFDSFFLFVCLAGLVHNAPDDCRFKSGNYKGCPHNGKCIPFGKEWTVDGGEVLRCVGDKTHFYLESVMGGFCKDNYGGFKGCLYQGLCQPFESSWKDFRGATLKCEEDEKRGYNIRTIKPGFCRDETGGYIGCIYEDKCHIFGKTWVTQDCQTMECKGNKWSFRNGILRKGVKTAEGKCE